MLRRSSKNINFIVLVFLFFGWGFVTCLNDLLTPILKEIFILNYFQANLVAFAFFVAYFIGSVIYIAFSMLGFNFFINLGYKGLILFGLLLSAVGCLLFIPATILKSYSTFLYGIFMLGFGFTYLQISTNPLVLLSGNEQTGASRLNLSQGFNSLATTIAPILGVYVFYGLLDIKNNHNNLKFPYIFFSAFFLLLMLIVYIFLHTSEEKALVKINNKPYSLNHANLLFGCLAIFFYVGAEVSIGTNLVGYLKSDATVLLSDTTAGKFLAFYWGGAMIGRFLGSIALINGTKIIKKIALMLLITILLTTVVIVTASIDGINLTYYILFQILAIILFLLSRNSRSNIIFFAIVNIMNILIGISIYNSWFAVWAVLSVGLFNSIMWPNIFDLAMDGLGQYREQGSSFLVMMVLGGAMLPLLQGYIADKSDIVTSFAVPIIGYLYILCYGIWYSKYRFNFIK